MGANENQLQIEVLQPEISSQIQKGTSEELKSWIKDDKLKPNHQIRINNLNWIEAHKIPAFQALFELKKNEQKPQSKNFNNQPSSISNTFTKRETNDTVVKNPPKTAEPSAAFKIFEKKSLAKSKTIGSKNEQIKSKNKHPQILSERPKQSLFVKKTLGFLAGCIVMLLLSLGGSYLWVYQLKTPVEIDENNSPELSSLDYKLTSDKLELRVKAANELKNTDNQEQSGQPLDISQEIAKLENQYNSQRKNVIENYRIKLQNDDFYTNFYFSFAVLLCLLLIIRVFYGKNAEATVNQHSSKLPEVQPNVPAAFVQKVNLENSHNTDKPESANVHITKSSEAHTTNFPNKIETSKEILETTENSDTAESLHSGNCLFHQDKLSKFVCENCTNYFCDECPKTFDDKENCCPLCKLACKSVDEKVKEAAIRQSDGREKKKTNLLDLGTHTDFVVYDYPDERRRKLGIIPAFVIALLFSISISILWVYKISPYLENRGKEISQNTSPDKNQEAKKGEEAKTSEQSANQNTAADSSANEPCIDPQTKQPFECNEETRMVLHDQTMKTKSVEKAQKETAEKTGSILSLILPSSSSTSENANQQGAEPNSVDAARKELEKQQLIKIFICSFLIIFGLQMLTRLFSKEERPEQP